MIKEKIERILAEKLSARYVEVHEESARHASHREALRTGGGHYRVMIVSEKFEGLTLIQRHRKVYDALKGLMEKQVHALAILALTPEECEKKNEEEGK